VGSISRGRSPALVRAAAVLVGLEGLAGLVIAIVFVVRGLAGTDQRIVNGFGNAAWFCILGTVVLVAAWALWTGRRWGRGIAVFTQLLILPATWYMGVGSHQWFYGIPIAAVALGALVLLFSPQTLRWLSYLPASADNSGPETR
jgi:peptidoglycan/LPS O-acetylase OafA/YrhL